ncbi:MAG: alpha/beta fold hydrolase [Hyphomonadaceae bacterium]|nr:alpha/beta fold hydrolase [Hyphomonadaceae bacterium]
MKALKILALAAVSTIALTAAAQADVIVRRVSFMVEKTRVVGDLYLPEGASARAPRPGAVVVGPQTNVKEQVPATYARELAKRGFVALAIDHRGFGESGGLIRQFEDPGSKVEDIRAAVTFLRSTPEIDHGRVGLLGICSGGGYAAKAASEDPSIGALVTVAGFFHDPHTFRTWLGGNYEVRLAMGRAARELYERTGEVAFITNVDPTSLDVAMPGREAYDWYGTARGAKPNWENRSATMFFETFLTFDAIRSGPSIRAATMVVHSDNALVPDSARRFAASIMAPTEVVWTNSVNHVAFYDEDRLVTLAADSAARWFTTQL